MGLFGSYFLKLFLRTVFENTGMMFSDKCSCYLNLGYVWFLFLKTHSILKNKEDKENRENMFGYQFSFVLKNTENTKTLTSENKNCFQRTPF